MLYVIFEPDGIKATTDGQLAQLAQKVGYKYECRCDWKTMEQAEDIARRLTESMDQLYIATDEGRGTSPRYDVVRMFAVGEKVSYSFNGDTTPCGEIVSISKTLKKIVTSNGSIFYRRRQTGGWIKQGVWGLCRGHIYERNPSF